MRIIILHPACARGFLKPEIGAQENRLGALSEAIMRATCSIYKLCAVDSLMMHFRCE